MRSRSLPLSLASESNSSQWPEIFCQMPAPSNHIHELHRRKRKILRRRGLQHSLLVAAISLAPPPTGGISAFGEYRSQQWPHHSSSFHHRLPVPVSYKSSSLALAGRNHTDSSGPHDHQNLEDDITKKLSVSKDRSVSALSPTSHPKARNTSPLHSRRTKKEKNLLNSQRATVKRNKSGRMNGRQKTGRDRLERSKQGLGRATGKYQRTSENKPTYSSLLPPPLAATSSENEEDDPLSTGLSSWEEFLGAGGGSGQNSSSSRRRAASKDDPDNERRSRLSNFKSSTNGIPVIGDELAQRLPSIQDLFPPDLSASNPSPFPPGESSPSSSRARSQVSLDGVLPVSDLFYRSSSSEEHDDEELPFSAEQSDAVSSENNKVRIRRNLAAQKTSPPTNTRQGPPRKARGRKMIRRGMEMLVGGVPINADPPQRSVKLLYDQRQKDWVSAISLNTRDFGPFWHTASIPKLIDTELGLFAEYWTRAALKWDICPKDLRQVAKSYSVQNAQRTKGDLGSPSSSESKSQRSAAIPSSGERITQASTANAKPPKSSDTEKRSTIHDSVEVSASKTTNPKAELLETDGECTFELGLSVDDLESSPSEVFESVFSRAFLSVIRKASTPKNDRQGDNDLRIEIPNLFFTETDDGYTDVHVSFKIVATSATDANPTELEKRTKRLNEILQQAMDDGEIAVALAAAAQEEKRWPDTLRERFIEECLFQDDVLDEDVPTTEPPDYSIKTRDQEIKVVEDDETDPLDLTLSEPESARLYTSEDIFLGSGKDSVFHDFSAGNALNAPYRGEIGLRLVDSVVERAKQRCPRVIAIGDVHGCIDELQDLLRECDYRPGDLVLFLGDLVCKGPDSISVVQMAREIGAVGVRGNHDFEVVRWHQAIKSGVDPPVVGSEHFHIASCLSKAEMKWMYSLPWYISSKDLGALFVHAGFVSGIRLAKQNPRLMMNMRSILPDGTVTSKFFNNWPWARLWDGPQTVLFGHDADRGLQQYEHAIGLDTGCVYGGRLTACILPEKRLVSVSARREYFKYRRKHYD